MTAAVAPAVLTLDAITDGEVLDTVAPSARVALYERAAGRHKERQ